MSSKICWVEKLRIKILYLGEEREKRVLCVWDLLILHDFLDFHTHLQEYILSILYCY